jgi:hypothetical protein
VGRIGLAIAAAGRPWFRVPAASPRC